jgi:hypothetical protein
MILVAIAVTSNESAPQETVARSHADPPPREREREIEWHSSPRHDD